MCAVPRLHDPTLPEDGKRPGNADDTPGPLKTLGLMVAGAFDSPEAHDPPSRRRVGRETDMRRKNAPKPTAEQVEAARKATRPTCPPPDPDKPYMWLEGRWLLVVTDKADDASE